MEKIKELEQEIERMKEEQRKHRAEKTIMEAIHNAGIVADELFEQGCLNTAQINDDGSVQMYLPESGEYVSPEQWSRKYPETVQGKKRKKAEEEGRAGKSDSIWIGMFR